MPKVTPENIFAILDARIEESDKEGGNNRLELTPPEHAALLAAYEKVSLETGMELQGALQYRSRTIEEAPVVTAPPVKVMVSIPTIDGKPHVDCVNGLLEVWGKIPCVVVWHRGSFLPRLRDRMVHSFMESDCTHLLCVDSDIKWGFSDLVGLLALAKDFAFAGYMQKGGEQVCMRHKVRAAQFETVADVADVTVKLLEPAEWESCGFGFVLLTRQACKTAQAGASLYFGTDGVERHALFHTMGYDTSSEGTRHAEGEDSAFCRRWRGKGGHIYTDPRVSVGHIAEQVLGVPCIPFEYASLMAEELDEAAVKEAVSATERDTCKCGHHLADHAVCEQCRMCSGFEREQIPKVPRIPFQHASLIDKVTEARVSRAAKAAAAKALLAVRVDEHAEAIELQLPDGVNASSLKALATEQEKA